MIKMHYWVSQNGEAPTGTYAEDQIRGMWANGAVLGDDFICATGSFHNWMPLSILIDAFEANKQYEVDQRKNTAMRLALASKWYERQKKNLAVAIIMSILIPMGGQCYTREWRDVIIGWLICLTILAIPLIWIASICDCPRAVIRHNQKLAKRLGL
jgi:hypothetical protein